VKRRRDVTRLQTNVLAKEEIAILKKVRKQQASKANPLNDPNTMNRKEFQI
jgi:hypothetical protein